MATIVAQAARAGLKETDTRREDPPMRCPSCAAELVVDERYPTWCECGYGLTAPPPPRRSLSAVDRAYAAAGKRLGERAYRRLAAGASLAPRLTAPLVLALVIAALVHLACAALLLGGLALIWFGFPMPLVLLIGVLMVAAGFLMRPRVGAPPDEGMVERAQAPALWRLVDDVADALETAPPDRLVVDARFNAFWSEVGLRRTRVLTLGLPLLAALPPRERVAVVAHELAHARNGDLARSWFIGSAVHGLGELAGLLTPAAGTDHEETALLEVLSRMLLRVLRLPVDGLLAAEAHLLMQDSRRAEYLADALAADVAGTDAALALEVSMLLGRVVEEPARRRAVTGVRDAAGLLDEARAAVVAVPERERERRRRVARLEGTRLLDTHPPSGLRIALLEQRPHRPARVTLDAAASERIDAELSVHVPEVERRLLDACAGRLYAG
jgi:Zn-dependent protease with chaperone function